MESLMVTSGVVGKPSKAVQDPNLCYQAGSFKYVVDGLERINSEITSKVNNLDEKSFETTHEVRSLG